MGEKRTDERKKVKRGRKCVDIKTDQQILTVSYQFSSARSVHNVGYTGCLGGLCVFCLS